MRTRAANHPRRSTSVGPRSCRAAPGRRRRRCRPRVVDHRHYDPTTRSFLSVDPELRQTNQTSLYADDNPTSRVDPTGERSEGYCFWGSLGWVSFSGWGSACLVEVNGNAQVGWTLTLGGGAQLSWSVLYRAVTKNIYSMAKLLSASAGVAYSVSNANSLKDLSSWFYSRGGTICVASYCGMYNYFNGPNGRIHGQMFGFGKTVGGSVDVAATTGEDYTWTGTFHGTVASYVAGIITGLNLANPLHWLAGPLNLYTA
jgi:hypothetical protein